jgi:hypothetical protein
MADSYLQDYTKYRANQVATTWSGEALPEVDDYIGRPDYIKVKTVSEGVTASGIDDAGTILV